MAKCSLVFKTPDTVKIPKGTPLSPCDVNASDQHATVTGMLASLSPFKPSSQHTSKYFDGELTDSHSIMRVVGFDRAKQQELQGVCNYSIPINLRDCQIQQNKFKNTFEVVVKSHTKIEASQTQFDVAHIKTAGRSVIELDKVN